MELNNKFFHLIGHKHPTIWKLIDTIKKQESAVSTIIARNSIGNPVKKTKKLYIDMQIQLQNLIKDYIQSRKTISQFLREIAYNKIFCNILINDNIICRYFIIHPFRKFNLKFYL
ncbi:hypothetical protein A3Q56_01455 [Intoshia linei]|uniref:Uncharacterized protein n=1 Tax=Intoshia linei TaxID=1819745 RepID=A0A177BB47_9BILA|nr:hypothetical protein A3Q56_01455 [Intoshia linei]